MFNRVHFFKLMADDGNWYLIAASDRDSMLEATNGGWNTGPDLERLSGGFKCFACHNEVDEDEVRRSLREAERHYIDMAIASIKSSRTKVFWLGQSL